MNIEPMRDMPMEADSPDRRSGPGSVPASVALPADGAVLRTWCHAANIGRIALALAEHDIGDMGDCSINDPIVLIIDEGNRRTSASSARRHERGNHRGHLQATLIAAFDGRPTEEDLRYNLAQDHTLHWPPPPNPRLTQGEGS